MSRGKSIRTLCPRCGYDYGVRADEMVRSPKCAFSRGGQSDSATSQTRHLWTECSGSQTQLGYWDHQVSRRVVALIMAAGEPIGFPMNSTLLINFTVINFETLIPINIYNAF